MEQRRDLDLNVGWKQLLKLHPERLENSPDGIMTKACV